jgi:hypothetical protein
MLASFYISDNRALSARHGRSVRLPEGLNPDCRRLRKHQCCVAGRVTALWTRSSESIPTHQAHDLILPLNVERSKTDAREDAR